MSKLIIVHRHITVFLWVDASKLIVVQNPLTVFPWVNVQANTLRQTSLCIPRGECMSKLTVQAYSNCSPSHPVPLGEQVQTDSRTQELTMPRFTIQHNGCLRQVDMFTTHTHTHTQSHTHTHTHTHTQTHVYAHSCIHFVVFCHDYGYRM